MELKKLFYLGLMNCLIVKDIKESIVRQFLVNDKLKLSTVKKVFIYIDYIQIKEGIIFEVYVEDDGGLTLSLYYKHYIMDVYSNEDVNIIWLEKETEEVFYKENVSDLEIIKYIDTFKEIDL